MSISTLCLIEIFNSCISARKFTAVNFSRKKKKNSVNNLNYTYYKNKAAQVFISPN